MGLVKTRRLAALQKQQRTKAGMRPPVVKCGVRKGDDPFWKWHDTANSVKSKRRSLFE